MKRLSPVVAPVLEYIAPAPAVLCPSPVVEYIAPATLICRPTPVVEYIAPVPTSTPVVSSPPLTSLEKACDVARGSPVASLLVPVAMREQLLAFEKQLEDHEVAVLELERQVAVLELGENFKQLSDLVNEAKALEWERQLVEVELEAHIQRFSDLVNGTASVGCACGGPDRELQEGFSGGTYLYEIVYP